MKNEWNKHFTTYLRELDQKKPVIWTGDLNVAPTQIGNRLHCEVQFLLATDAYTQISQTRRGTGIRPQGTLKRRQPPSRTSLNPKSIQKAILNLRKSSLWMFGGNCIPPSNIIRISRIGSIVGGKGLDGDWTCVRAPYSSSLRCSFSPFCSSRFEQTDHGEGEDGARVLFSYDDIPRAKRRISFVSAK